MPANEMTIEALRVLEQKLTEAYTLAREAHVAADDALSYAIAQAYPKVHAATVRYSAILTSASPTLKAASDAKSDASMAQTRAHAALLTVQSEIRTRS